MAAGEAGQQALVLCLEVREQPAQMCSLPGIEAFPHETAHERHTPVRTQVAWELAAANGEKRAWPRLCDVHFRPEGLQRL